MKTSRFKEAQIIQALKEAEGGRPIAELCRGLGISEQCFYNWRRRYGGLEVSELRRLKQLEQENQQLRRVVSQQALDLDALKSLLSKKW